MIHPMCLSDEHFVHIPYIIVFFLFKHSVTYTLKLNSLSQTRYGIIAELSSYFLLSKDRFSCDKWLYTLWRWMLWMRSLKDDAAHSSSGLVFYLLSCLPQTPIKLVFFCFCLFVFCFCFCFCLHNIYSPVKLSFWPTTNCNRIDSTAEYFSYTP